MVAISVIIPVYNAEDFLEESLNSVLNQNFKDFEVICVNDGSKDNSLNILNKYQKKDKRIKVISQKNSGDGGARNKGLKNATGDFVYFLDSDDILFPYSLEKMYDNAINNDSDLVLFKVAWLTEDKPLIYNRPIFDFDKKFKKNNFQNFTFNYRDIKYYVMNSGYFPIWAKFYRKRFLDNFPNDLIFSENTAFGDVLFHITSLILASKISFVDDFLYQYRLSNPKSLSHDNSNKMDIFEVIDSVENFLIENNFYDEFKKEFTEFKIHQCLYYIPISNSSEYFNKAYEELSKLNIDDLSLSNNFKGRCNLLLDSKNYSDYLHRLIYYNETLNNTYHIISNSKEISKLIKVNKKYKKQIDEMKSSNSWKITTPLRKLMSIFK